MTLRYEEPSIPTGETILTRAHAKIVRDDITWLADQVTLVPTNAVVHGTGEPGVEGIPLAAGKLLTVQYGRGDHHRRAPGRHLRARSGA